MHTCFNFSTVTTAFWHKYYYMSAFLYHWYTKGNCNQSKYFTLNPLFIHICAGKLHVQQQLPRGRGTEAAPMSASSLRQAASNRPPPSAHARSHEAMWVKCLARTRRRMEQDLNHQPFGHWTTRSTSCWRLAASISLPQQGSCGLFPLTYFNNAISCE